jgi:two-component system chemotaxis response regulator CheB
MREVRAVIVGSSPTVRSLLRRLIAGEGVDVVGDVSDPSEAAEAVARLQPDVVVLDADLADGGVAAAEAITTRRPTPILVLAPRRRHLARLAFETLTRGALGVFAKPETPDEWQALGPSLAEIVRQVATPGAESPAARPASSGLPSTGGLRYVAVGASTGGPVALRAMLGELEGTSLGVAVVQHIAAGFEDGLAEWLARETRLDVRVATDGEPLAPGRVRMSRPGAHLVVDREGTLHHDTRTPPVRGHRPSVNLLFSSFLGLGAGEVAAVILTGMGDDGVAGMVELRRAGALTVAQDRRSCAVFGMPRAALERDAAVLELEPGAIGRMLSRITAGRV